VSLILTLFQSRVATSDPITFVVFYKPFFNNKTTFGQNITNCLFGPIDNAFQHNKLTMSTWRLSLTKKPLANGGAMERLS
jgi:hypothetical protein